MFFGGASNQHDTEIGLTSGCQHGHAHGLIPTTIHSFMPTAVNDICAVTSSAIITVLMMAALAQPPGVECWRICGPTLPVSMLRSDRLHPFPDDNTPPTHLPDTDCPYCGEHVALDSCQPSAEMVPCHASGCRFAINCCAVCISAGENDLW